MLETGHLIDLAIEFENVGIFRRTDPVSRGPSAGNGRKRQTPKCRSRKAAFSTDGVQQGAQHFILGLDGL